MNLNIYNEELERISVIGDRFISCLWSEGYNTIQTFTLELQETDEYRKNLRPDYYIGRSDRKTLMVIKTVQIKDGKITASGKQASRVLKDVAFVGKINGGSVATEAIRTAYEGSSKFYNTEFALDDIPNVYGEEIADKDFLELCTTVCQSTDIGFRAVKNQSKILIEFYKPEANPNLVFSEDYGNLVLQSVTLSTENLKNYAIVLGEGDGESQVRVDVDMTNGEHRREMIVDAKSTKRESDETEEAYLERLRANGVEKLLSQARTWETAILPIAGDFGTRYDLGDILTVLLPQYGLRLHARVSRFNQKFQNNKTTTTVEVGEITITR